MGEQVYVVSLIVESNERPMSLLLGVRRAVPTSMRHPSVLSTLTMRVPQGLFQSLLDDNGLSKSIPAVGAMTATYAGPTWHFGVPGGLASNSVFVVESILSRKVGLGDALVEGKLSGAFRAIGLARDVVEDPKGETPAETTLMLSFSAIVSSGTSRIPESTASYAPLAWVKAEDLQRAVERHDALILLPDANPWEVCLHGLCMKSAAEFWPSAHQGC